MTQQDFFENAKWVGASERTTETFSVLRGCFEVTDVKSASLNVLGLGFFKCYINGECINPHSFLPLSTDYEAGSDPVDEVISHHRVYVPQFDITPFVKNGKNTIAIHFGGGWYTFRNRAFGLPKAIYCLTVDDKNGTTDFISDEGCQVGKSFVYGYEFNQSEHHDYNDYNNCLAPDFDDSAWDNAVPTEVLDTDYCTTDCPTDALIEELSVKVVKKADGTVTYDCGENTTGHVLLKIDAPKGEKITVRFSEELSADGSIDEEHHHDQSFTVISDGTPRLAEAYFTWFGFRYFEVTGNATPLCVKVIHANVPVNSTFDSDNETLNWIYKTFTHTMNCNMHTGLPSDCPHLERRGYTGDGQLTCNAVLTTFDARKFYEKWMKDIGDCQDVLSGHIQYTAPYIHSGGGPGGWGCAIVEVPYQLYRHYGEKDVLERYYPQMRRYIDYLEAHSDYGLVTSDKEGNWCLGDWCGPNILYPDRDITSHNQQVFLPAPMVNTYFMVKSLKQMCEIARIIGKEDDISEYEEKINYRKGAITAAYFNTFDDNFVMNVQGANCFAVDLGLGSEGTYKNMVDYYTKLGYYDTGIFGTDIVTRLFFEKGDSDLAVQLLTHDGDQGYEHWRKNGATTFHEYWDSNRSRSHSHPMFGAPVQYIFQYLLGISQREGTVAYRDLVIEPCSVSLFGRMSGSITTPQGFVGVSYVNENGKTSFTITIPEGTKAVFRFNNEELTLSQGENTFSF